MGLKKHSCHESDLLGFDLGLFLKIANTMYFSAVVCSRHASSSLFSTDWLIAVGLLIGVPIVIPYLDDLSLLFMQQCLALTVLFSSSGVLASSV